MSRESRESKDWRKYEKKIYEELSKIYPGCEFEFDDKIWGKYSKIDRQIDISIRGEIGEVRFWGLLIVNIFQRL